MAASGSAWLDSRLRWLEGVEGYPAVDWSGGKPADDSRNLAAKMDANENLFLPKTYAAGLVKHALREAKLNLYPTYEYYELAAAIARYLDVPVQNIALGNGSDQIIDLLISGFLIGDDSITTTRPGFTFYRVRGGFQGFKTKEIPLGEGFEFSADEMLANSSGSKLAFIASPNNPTGTQFGRAQIERLAENFPGLVVLDEAYAEFARESLVKLTSKYQNLVVLRTFSKAFGLAGLRVGYMIAGERIAKTFRLKMQYPYGITSLGVRVAKNALKNLGPVRRAIAEMKRERAWLFKQLSDIEGVRIWPSEANFLFAQLFRNIEWVRKELVRARLLVREFPAEQPDQRYLRITVAKRSVNQRFLRALSAGLGS